MFLSFGSISGSPIQLYPALSIWSGAPQVVVSLGRFCHALILVSLSPYFPRIGTSQALVEAFLNSTKEALKPQQSLTISCCTYVLHRQSSMIHRRTVTLAEAPVVNRHPGTIPGQQTRKPLQRPTSALSSSSLFGIFDRPAEGTPCPRMGTL